VALVDAEDYERVSQFKWGAIQKKHLWYAHCGWANIYMHQLVFGPHTHEIDHKNGNGLDNRKANLREATRSQQTANARKTSKPTSSVYKGVVRCRGAWRAQIQPDGKCIYLGSFQSEEEAARAYDDAAREVFGEFANTNF
jgi:hypothetical protein